MNPDFSWIMFLSFYLTQGIVFALILNIIVFKLISMIVDIFWKTKLPTVVLPHYVTDLEVRHAGKYIIASCTAHRRIYSHVVLVASHDSVALAAMAAQTALINKVESNHVKQPD